MRRIRPLGIGADDQIVIRVDGQRPRVRLFRLEENRSRARRRHAMNLALIAGGDEQIARFRKRQRPDILGLRIVEHFGFSRGVHAINLAVRRRRRVDAILPVDGDRLNRHAVELGERLRLARRVDCNQLGLRAAQSAAAGVTDCPSNRARRPTGTSPTDRKSPSATGASVSRPSLESDRCVRLPFSKSAISACCHVLVSTAWSAHERRSRNAAKTREIFMKYFVPTLP